MTARRAEPAHGCYYCGRPIRKGLVCSSCTDLYQLDPLGQPAHRRLTEHELGLPSREHYDAPDQWRQA